MGAILIISTTSSEEEAQTIATTLVERHLAACVNIIPGVQSTYTWKGETCHEEEWMLMIKTVAPNFEMTARALQELHSYEVPEIISIPIQEGDESYLNWLAAATRDPDG